MKARQRNLLKALGETGCYSMMSPRMSRKEFDELGFGGLGYRIQSSSLHGADTSSGSIFTWLDE